MLEMLRIQSLRIGGESCFMILVPQFPKKVKYLLDFSYPLVAKLSQRTATQQFVGGRPGYEKALLFQWLLMKKIMNWDYRTTAEMAGISHPTLIRANEMFLRTGMYEKVLKSLVKLAKKEGLMKGAYVAMDSTFVKTFSRKKELGSEGYNGKKEAYGFKFHLLIDVPSGIPLALKLTNGLAHDSTLALTLLKSAKPYLKEVDYVLADKAYDSVDIIRFIAKELRAKAGIPIVKRKRGKNYTWEGAWRNFHEKAKGRSIKKSIYNRRTEVERTFSQLKRVYKLGQEELKGILNFAKQVYLSLICYTIKKLWTKGITKI